MQSGPETGIPLQTLRRCVFALQSVRSENLEAISKELKRNSSNLEEAVRREQRKLNEGERGSLQGVMDVLRAGLRSNTQLMDFFNCSY